MTAWKRVAIDEVVKLMHQHKLSAVALAAKLERVGFKASPQAIRNKLGRGGFSAEFLLAVIGAIAKDQEEKGSRTGADVCVTLSGAKLVAAYCSAVADLETHGKQMEHFRVQGIASGLPPAVKRDLERQLKRHEKRKVTGDD